MMLIAGAAVFVCVTVITVGHLTFKRYTDA